MGRLLHFKRGGRNTKSVALRGAVPREVIPLLQRLAIDPFALGSSDSALVAAFERHPLDHAWEVAISRNRRHRNHDYVLCENPYVIASLLLSRLARTTSPFLTASASSFELLEAALKQNAQQLNLMFVGETGTGKRSLAELLCRISGEMRPLRFNCAVPHDVQRALASGSPIRTAADGITLLERMDEVPPEYDEPLARMIRLRRGAVRFIATLRRRLDERCELAAEFAPPLEVSALRERRVDLTMLASHFLRDAGPQLRFDGSALAELGRWHFAGNVRELRNLITEIVIYQSDSNATISAQQVQARASDHSSDRVKGRAELRVEAALRLDLA